MTIAEFLVTIASDPKLLEEFGDTDRQSDLLGRYDLTDEQRQFLSSNDLRIVRVKVEGELMVGDERVAFHTICGPITIHGVDPSDLKLDSEPDSPAE